MTQSSDVLSLHEPSGLNARGTLLVIAGRGEDPDVYRRFGSRVAFDAYRVHVVNDPTVDPDRSQDQILRLLEADTAPGPAVLVGSDAGALFAAALLAEGELTGVEGLILAGLPVTADGRDAQTWEAELEDRTTCPTHRGNISDAIVRAGALYEPLPDGWIERAALDAINQPILGLHGEEDPIADVDVARALYATLPAAEFVQIAGARHDVLNDQTHRTVAATIVLWLERLRTGNGLAAIAALQPAGAKVA